MLPVVVRNSVSYAGMAARRICHRHSAPDLPSEQKALGAEISEELLKIAKSSAPKNEDQLQEAFASVDVKKTATSSPRSLKLIPSALWTLLAKGSDEQAEELSDSAVETPISAEMQEALSSAGAALQESGWGWLRYDPKTQMIQLSNYGSQDPSKSEIDMIPLLESILVYQKFVLTKFF